MWQGRLSQLEVGQVVRLSESGPAFRVTRVTLGAAYLKRRNAVPKLVQLLGGRSFLASEEGGVLAVAPRSYVYHEVPDAPGPWERTGKTCGECERGLPSWQQDGTLCPACVEAERVEMDRDCDVRPTLTADDDPYYTGEQQAAAEADDEGLDS